MIAQILAYISLFMGILIFIIYLFVLNNLSKKSYHPKLAYAITSIFLVMSIAFSFLTYSTFSDYLDSDTTESAQQPSY